MLQVKLREERGFPHRSVESPGPSETLMETLQASTVCWLFVLPTLPVLMGADGVKFSG